MKDTATLALFVMEGPAGSGKSFQISINNDLWTEVPRVATLPRPRSYDGLEGIMLSQLKDMQTSTVLAYQDPSKTYVVDRWLLSQLVYGSIRQNRGLHSGYVFELIKSGIQNIACAFEEKMIRSRDIQPSFKLNIVVDFLILLPTVELLTMQRSGGKKEYPYDPETEIKMYRTMADILSSQDIEVHTFESDYQGRELRNAEIRSHVETSVRMTRSW